MGLRACSAPLVWAALVIVPISLHPALRLHQLITWNVGQGQWVTRITTDKCQHFDLGGEWFPKQIWAHCRGRQNQIALTHWDLDHIRFVKTFMTKMPGVCVYHLPIGDHPLKKWMQAFPKCLEDPAIVKRVPNHISKIHNDMSSVFILAQKVLITGDAPRHLELDLLDADDLKNVQIYVAGHHGSRTSSSPELLNRLRQTKVAVVSARKRKYGHPHLQVLYSFRHHSISAVRTEDWGHIMIELN